MKKREEILATKEFGQYRVLLVKALGGSQVRITDIKACGRIVVKLETMNGMACFESISPETVELMVKAVEHSRAAADTKRQLALSVDHYIYGTLDWIESDEMFNPIAARKGSA